LKAEKADEFRQDHKMNNDTEEPLFSESCFIL